MITNLESRREGLRRLVGKMVRVEKLGGLRPEDEERDIIYVPLPEYGFALWHFVEEEQI